MGATRVNKAARGKEGVFGVKLGGGSTYTLVGSVTNIDYSGSAGTEEYSCREEKTSDYNGDHEASVTLQGFVFYRASGDLATNVDARNFEAWMASETVIDAQVKSLLEGDVTRTGEALITQFSEGMPQEGRQTYNVTIMFRGGLPTLGVEPGA